MTHKTITVSVPASPAYLALAEKFLSECRQHAEKTPDLIELSETIQTAYANINQLAPQGVESGVPQEIAETYDDELPENFNIEEFDAVAPEPPVAPAPPPPPPAKIEYELTEKAGAFTLEQYLGQGWTEEALIEDGYLRPKAPAVPAPPPPPTPAPSTAAVQSVTNVPTAPMHSGGPVLDVDKDGRPWDADIDSGSKEKNADGRWKKRKNLDPNFYEQRKALLLAMVKSGAPAQTAVNAPTPPAATATTTTAPAGGLSPGAQLIRDFNNKMKEDPERVNQVTFLAAVKAAGLSAIKDVSAPANVHLIPAIRNALFGG